MKEIHTLSCQQLAESMTSYLEGAISDEDKKLIDTHLAKCNGCHNYLEQMLFTVRAVGALRGDCPTEATRARLLSLFRAWKADREDC